MIVSPGTAGFPSVTRLPGMLVQQVAEPVAVSVSAEPVTWTEYGTPVPSAPGYRAFSRMRVVLRVLPGVPNAVAFVAVTSGSWLIRLIRASATLDSVSPDT